MSPSSPVSSARIQVITEGRDTTEEALIRLLCLYPQIKPRREQSRAKTRLPLWTDIVDRHESRHLKGGFKAWNARNKTDNKDTSTREPTDG